MEFGDITVENRAPDVFRNSEIRTKAQASLKQFEKRNGELPLKYRYAQFLFDRKEPIATADSPLKLLAWSGDDLELAASILSHIQPEQRSVVLRSNMIDVSDDTPTLQINSRSDIDDFIAYVNDRKNGNQSPHESTIWTSFFAKIADKNSEATDNRTLSRTVVQVVPNIVGQKGIFLLRPTFIYDEPLRREIQGYRVDYPQKPPDLNLQLESVPENFVGFRLLPIGEFAREKKTNLGYMVIYNPASKSFSIRSGFADIKHYTDADSRVIQRQAMGRSVDYEQGNRTTFHYHLNDQSYALDDVTGLETLSLNEGDISYLENVLSWQLPRIFSFQKEIEQQEWIKQEVSTTHQLVILPPPTPGDLRINTQYFDFHPYGNKEQLEEKAQFWYKKDFDTLSTQQKVISFF